jgi:hypothetical protein
VIDAPIQTAYRAAYDRQVATLRAVLTEAVFASAWAEGRTLSLDQAIKEADRYVRSGSGTFGEIIAVSD